MDGNIARRIRHESAAAIAAGLLGGTRQTAMQIAA